MAIATKEIRIPSLRVDRTFLTGLGKILEHDAAELRGNLTDVGAPPVTVSYVVESGWRKRVTFVSIDTLAAAPLPAAPRRFTAHVHPSDRALIEAHLRMEPLAPVAAVNTVSLSSTDPARLAKTEGDLKQLFRNARRGYHSWLPHFSHRLFAALVSLGAAWLYYRWVDAQDIPPGMRRDLWWVAIVPVAFLAYQGSFRLLRRLYPKYEFVMDKGRPLRARLRSWLSVLLAVVAIVAAIDIFLVFTRG
jgi:hypothetical protein